ncbi:MAG: type II toxin-antitoxin system VapC family toxin [Jatrophihabitantaceae bacterium]
MIVDTSAVVAIVLDASDAERFARALVAAPARSMSAASYVEAGAVLDSRRDPVVSRRLDDLLDAAGIELAPVSVEQAHIARAAYRDFGRGSGHPAGLNFGDCLAYALAIDRHEPLLFKGDDFSHTDVAVVEV